MALENTAHAICRDAVARDFGANALLWDPIQGMLLDYVDSVWQIANKHIAAAALPISSLGADPIRCLRCASLALP